MGVTQLSCDEGNGVDGAGGMAHTDRVMGRAAWCACLSLGETIQTGCSGRYDKGTHAQDFSAAICGTAL